MDPLGVAVLADGQPGEEWRRLPCDGCGAQPWEAHEADCPVIQEREDAEELPPEGWAGP